MLYFNSLFLQMAYIHIERFNEWRLIFKILKSCDIYVYVYN
jgi:hypothetical protein